MKKVVNKNKWVASFALVFACTISFAIIGSNVMGPKSFPKDSDSDVGEKDSVKKKQAETPILDSVSLPYKYKSQQDLPYENLNEPSGLRLGKTPSLKTQIDYNPETGDYDVYDKMGVYENNTPYSLSQQEYDNYALKKYKKGYWNQKASNHEKGKSGGLLNGVVGNVLGDNNPIDIKTQGSAELTFGGKYSRTYNPSLTKQQQRMFNFDFTNKIQMSITGKVGNKVSMKVKYDTESQFDFENQMKLDYTGDEDEIIKKIEAGNVTFPIDNTLIKGSQSLMGFRADLQFGKLKVSGVLSRQRGEFSTINVDKGAQTSQFNIRCDNYEANKHFFLGHYFRDHYETAFKTSPEITDGVLIRRVEIWMTQTSAGKENARNVLALTDLGDTKVGNNYEMPSNQTDRLYQQVKNLPNVRDINLISNVMAQNNFTIGQNYEKAELAIKLKETQYTINNKLGYISLKSSVDPSKILAVAYEYEYHGKVYQVGEFSSDGVEHPNLLIVKLLKGSHLNTTYNNWDLMMKNIYSIGGYQISPDEFKLDILYEDAQTGKPIGYYPEEGKLKGKPLISIMNLDVISANKEPHPDGLFDFLEGYTINSQSGLIMFPVLEPFGSHLDNVIGDPKISTKYDYPQLYDSTQSSARQFAEKDKFLLKGSYKSSFSSDISLNTTQVQEGSVTVTAGGRKLVEGTDYTVDYAMGRVKIINQSLLESKTPIKVSLESNPLFSMRAKNLMGTKASYAITDKFKVGATLLRLSEVPLTTKVGFEDFPVNNTVWGLDGNYSTEVPFITRMVDKIPFINTKEKSTIKASAEFAQLIPSTSKLISQAVEVDYFENSQQSISLREPSLWVLAATPQGQSKLFPEGNLINDTRNGMNRAQLAWFDINNDYFFGYASKISKSLQSNVYAHAVMGNILFNKDPSSTVERPLTIINLAFYPKERGPYNYDVKAINGITAGINTTNGELMHPETRWGGITRQMNTTDFEEANVEYLQFWLMDPFYYDSAKTHAGGDLYFDLGMISEDILHDSRKFAENGLTNDPTKYIYTKLARVPNFQVVQTGFDNNVNRADQDVGFDGLGDKDEQNFFSEYLDQVKHSGVSGSVLEKINEDPSHDDFVSYIDPVNPDLSIYERYHYYNGSDGNSPAGNNQGTGRLSPDVEDINQDNTLQEDEAYYQYDLKITHKDLVVGKNYVVDRISEPLTGTKDSIGWYQIKIPINSDQKVRIGSISDFKSIQFMRMFLRGFKDSIYLRLAELALVRGTWRKYDNTIYEAGEYDLNNDAQVDLSSVSVQDNTMRTPIHYVLPPGVVRTIDPMNTLLTQQNESSLQMKVMGLDDGNAKAIYKMLNKDLRQFGELDMFVHGEAVLNDLNPIKDGDVTVFMRLGSDYTQNYYEYEVPLQLTKVANYTSGNVDSPDRLAVWPQENNFAINLKQLVSIKQSRDNLLAKNSGFTTDQIFVQAEGNNKISIKGNPSLGSVTTVMIGIRNKKKSSVNPTDDGLKKDVICWFDELRLTQFNEKGGWAASASTQITMADFATLSLDGKIMKPGFGGVDERIFERSQNEVDQFNVASSVALHKFFPDKLGLQLPFYVGWSESVTTPLYDPLSTDELLKAKLNNMTADSASKYKQLSQTFESRLSYNFTNVRITRPKPKFLHPFHVNNFTFTYAFNKIHNHSVDYVYEDRYDNKVALMYSYMIKSHSFEPFKSIKSNNLALIRDFNIGLLPAQYSIDNQFDKSYKESLQRNLSQYADPNYKFDPIYSKTFNWSRIYNLKWNLTKNLKLDYSANNVARVEEPQGQIYHDDSHKAYMSDYRDSVFNAMKTGGQTTDFTQKIDLSYKLPIDKIPFLSFVSSNVKYSGNYSWTRGYEVPNSTLNAGNIIKNSNNESFDGTVSLTKLYNKSKYLKEVDKRFSGRGKSKPKTENVKYTKDAVTIQAYTALEIKHSLKTTDVKLSVLDNKGKAIEGKTVVVDANKVTFTAEKDYDQAQVVVTGKREVKDPPWRFVADGVVHTLIMVKSVSINASQSLGSYVPGYDKTTQYFGLQHPFGADARPGWGYVFGYVPSFNDLENTVLDRKWLIANDSLLNDKFLRTYSNQIHLKTTIEPLNNFKVNLENNRTYSQNETQYLSNNATTMATSEKTTNGSFSISTNALKSNSLLNASMSDKTYAQFKSNLLIVADRLAAQRGTTFERDPITKFPAYYKSSSQDVLIPAFLAAYTGQNANKMYLNSYFTPLFSNVQDFLRSINWKVNYNGLSDIKFFKPYFKSITLTHGYTCTYSISNYQTFTSDNMVGANKDFYSDLVDGNVYLAPKYNISSVSIDERFNPILGIDTKLQNNITTKFEVRNNRTITMSLVNTEISEVGGYEYIAGVGYVFKNFTVNIKTAGTSKAYTNDINTRIDVSVRDNTTIRRTISDDVKSVIQGQKIWSLKWFADYMLTKQFTVRTFFDWTINQPRTNGFMTSNKNFGLNLRFSLI